MIIITQIGIKRLFKWLVSLTCLIVLTLTSCDRCWECSYEVEIITPTDTLYELVKETTCLKEEQESFQQEGYACTPQ